jgi:hypothetical protein
MIAVLTPTSGPLELTANANEALPQTDEACVRVDG